MDAKITKKRLSSMLSYDWLKIIGFAVALIMFWSLLFTVSGTRVRPSQQFSVLNHKANLMFESTEFYSHYNTILDKDVFSYEVLETTLTDIAETPDMEATLFEARFAISEADVMFISNLDDPDTETKDENGVVSYERTYMQSFVQTWMPYVADLDLQSETGLFKELENYLSNFYADWKNESTLDEKKVEEAFRLRFEQTKDKRFRRAERMQQGILDEIERIEKYRDALQNFYFYLDMGYISMTKIEVQAPDSWGDKVFTKYAINLCPNVETMGNLKEIACYQQAYQDENGDTRYATTAENMHLFVFAFSSVESIYKYESLLYVDYLVKSYCSEL